MNQDNTTQQPSVDKQAILAELAKLQIAKRKVKFNTDGSVDIRGDVEIPTKYTKIPVQFGHISGGLFCYSAQLTSLDGTPQRVDGSVYYRTELTSLDGTPQHIGGGFNCLNTQIKSLHNIHLTHVDLVIGDILTLPPHCTHLLGLAFIPGVRRVQVGWGATVIDVIHDVFEWQEKLLEMGLVEQAQL